MSTINSIKKVQSEMKDSLIEIKITGNNSRVDEAKNQIKYLEHDKLKKMIKTTKIKKN